MRSESGSSKCALAPRLDHEDVGPKVPQLAVEHLVENLQVTAAFGERLQRQVELQATAGSGAELAI